MRGGTGGSCDFEEGIRAMVQRKKPAATPTPVVRHRAAEAAITEPRVGDGAPTPDGEAADGAAELDREPGADGSSFGIVGIGASDAAADGAAELDREPGAARSSVGIVGIGASAGGLSSFTQLLEHLPADTGLAFVIVQHLERSHESHLVDLLSKFTSMSIVQAAQGVSVESDHIYVIPPNTTMLLSNGRLTLEPRPPYGQTMPIDLFFRSLALERRARAIGVILSGTGTDGTLGLEAIKAEGGITFAESQESAQYGAMPSSAEGAGIIDLVLPPTEIAREIVRMAGRMVSEDASTKLAAAPEQEGDLRNIFTLLRTAKGVDFTHYRQTTIKRRIIRRMLLHKIHTISDYLALLKEHPTEIDALYQDVLIRVTSFFRDPDVFEALKEKVFPALIDRRRQQDTPVRVWVPGCATGEEAYSIAICLAEYMLEQRMMCPVQLFGTDVSDTALEKARAGVYPENIAIDVSPERLRRFFARTGKTYQISQSIRESCVFALQNVTSDPPFSKLDLISCRNVLIYLSPVLQKKVLPTFHYALRPSGVLMLGSSETAGSAGDFFEVLDKKNKLYLKAPNAPRVGLELPLPRTPRFGAESRQPDRSGESESFSLHREADSLALTRYAPAGVIVNQDMQIVEFRGQTGPYLESPPGEPTYHLLKMAREGLAIELRTSIHKAQKTAKAVRTGVLEFRSHGAKREAILDVVPLRTGMREGKTGGRAHYFLISFEQPPPAAEAPGPAGKKQRGAKGAPGTPEGQQVIKLKQELAATREYLQSIIEEMEATNEELQSANEEILSSNEELQSINEELETAKEELQSINEELNTVNEELRSRNVELSQVNNDLNNSLSSVNLPIIMLSADLRIRRFTPVAEKVLHLIPTDIGRPIGDIRQRIDIPNLEELLTEVVQGVRNVTKDVQDQDGRWYSMRIRPYRTTDNKIEGAVLTLVDIDASMRTLDALRSSHMYAEALLETVHEPLLVLDEALRVQRVNTTFCETFQVKRESLEGAFVYELSNGPWDIHSLRILLEEILPKNAVLRDYRVEREFPEIGHRVFLLNARQILRMEGPADRILLAFRDVTATVTGRAS